MAQISNMRCFSVSQAHLGAPLQWTPAMGTAELDDLINDLIIAPIPLDEKRATVALQFFNSFNDELLVTGPVTRTFQVGPKVNSHHHTSAQPYSATPASAVLGMKRTREASPTMSSSKRMPGFSILTKDGVDITEYASRGPKTKAQREHAALMRKLKACDKCKRSKQRCDPSHHGIFTSPASSSSGASPCSSTRPDYSTPGSVLRGSISPQSALDNSFSNVAHSGKRFSPMESPASSFSSSDFAGEFAQVDADVFARIEARRQELQQQQAEVDAELAILHASQSLYASSAPTTYTSYASHDVGRYVDSHPFSFDTSLFVDSPTEDWLNDFDFQIGSSSESVPSLVNTSSQGSSDASPQDQSQGHPLRDPVPSGTLASPSRRRLPSPRPELDLYSFFDDVAVKAVVNSTVVENESPVQCNGDSPFDHNYRPEVEEGQDDFVLYPHGSVSQWSLQSVAKSIPNSRSASHRSSRSIHDAVAVGAHVPELQVQRDTRTLVPKSSTALLNISSSTCLSCMDGDRSSERSIGGSNRSQSIIQSTQLNTTGNHQLPEAGGSPLTWDVQSIIAMGLLSVVGFVLLQIVASFLGLNARMADFSLISMLPILVVYATKLRITSENHTAFGGTIEAFQSLNQKNLHSFGSELEDESSYDAVLSDPSSTKPALLRRYQLQLQNSLPRALFPASIMT